MNIFYLDQDITKCAQAHCDKHVISGINEMTQLIVCALVTQSVRNKMDVSMFKHIRSECNLPKAADTYRKNRFALWTGHNQKNFRYTLDLALALCQEKLRRWPNNPQHKYQEVLENIRRLNLVSWFDQANNIPMPIAVPVETWSMARELGYISNQDLDIVLEIESRNKKTNDFSNFDKHELFTNEEILRVYRLLYTHVKYEMVTYKYTEAPTWYKPKFA